MLAWAQGEAGELAEGLKLAEKVYDAYQRIYTQPTEASVLATLRLSRLSKHSGLRDRAVALVDEYIRNARKLYGDDNPNTTLGLSDRASLLFGAGRFEEAATQFGEVARAYRKGGNELNAAIVDGFVGDSLREAGRPAEALPLQRAALEVMRARYPKGQHVLVARALVNLALSEAAVGDSLAALAHFDEGLAMHRALSSDATVIANARALRGKVLFDSGRKAEGLAELRAALEDMKNSREGSPNQYWEPFALLTSAACERGAEDCATLKATCTDALKLSLAATTRARLEAAVSRE
jgi:serine/threonine-protein kinase